MEYDDLPWGQFTDIETKSTEPEMFTVLPYHPLDSDDDEERGGKDEETPIYWPLCVFAGGTLAGIVGALTFKFT